MIVAGFTFIRNAVKFDYPIVESIKSILPVCDNFIVCVGNSEDGTYDLIRSIDPEKIVIIDSVWDDNLREGGKVLAVETNKAFQAIPAETDWAFYIQGDEVVHEKYLDNIMSSMHKWKDNKDVEGLLFKYLHFYGSYDYIGISPRWYKNEIRIIRNNKKIYSYKDAQGFRINDNQKLKVKPIDAYVYHYGWVKEPKAMQKKQEIFNKYWHDDKWIETNISKNESFNYLNVDSLEKFKETHPQVMIERINQKNWKFDYDISFNKLSLKNKIKLFIEKSFNIDLGYKNYRIIH
ncbi:MAG: glycosyltransferase family 2 protein [Bacteroidota bacterium]|nr:glycosyltransferase family 2 protein [Bacteroidota bacterium]